MNTRMHTSALLVLFFFSGFAALVYQVLWVRELGLLFGSTAQAAALCIAIFFTGLALGGWFWGKRAPRFQSSLRWFGILEIFVALTALGHFGLVPAYHAVYPAIYASAGHIAALDTLTKVLIAATILLPPAFLMGGTLPLMGQHLIRARDRLATTGAVLYAVNTAGSATGALAAGFFLPLSLGFRNAYLSAVCIDLFVGFMAILIARHASAPASASASAAAPAAPKPVPAHATGPRPLLEIPPRLVWAAAFASGFATLGAEVVWTRMFAQVLQNSVYTYALVLSAFLVALALGAGAAGALARIRALNPGTALCALLFAGAAVLATAPWLFHRATGGLVYVGSDLGWRPYIIAVGMMTGLVLLLPAVILGAVLPYLLRTLENSQRAPGELIGRLVAVNTSGAIAGSLAAGFVLIPMVGAYRGMLLLAAIYPALAAAILFAGARSGARHAPAPTPSRRALRGAAAIAAAVTAVLLPMASTEALQNIRLRDRTERVIEVRESPQATVAVVQRGRDYVIRVNNYYTLGGTRGLDSERNQTVIPMLLHPEPREVFYLGMGTGITAGAALSFPVERVVVSEIIAAVADMSRAHFGPWINGLYEDPRVTVYADDGRNCLRRSRDAYDLIISDLFTPWKAGTGNLYTLEHYQTAFDRLRPGGIFAQWIPFYQVSELEFGIIARTMTEVFPQVVLWRGDLFRDRSIAALIGYRDAAPLDPAVAVRQLRHAAGDQDLPNAYFEALALRHYAGNITESGLYDDYPVNTDNFPRVEYLAPRSHRMARVGGTSFVVGAAREDLYARLRARVPLEEDPYLVNLDDAQRGYVAAGGHYSRYMHLDGAGDTAGALNALESFQALSPPESFSDLSPARVFASSFRGGGR